ncbi:hypothetical protein INT45_001114 [Circinella minor]|uniref:Uncharacterized protein n=1 Tax=Circinella minor TaxID=1195481 RepID=A0A8H7RVG8_9FUNG|nr:hypothetical protein INT45_001114 [Circinella minor]
MALTYLAGGRTLTGVILQSTWHQQNNSSSSASTTVSPTLRPLVSAIGELSSFLIRQTFSPPPTPDINTSFENSIQEPFSLTSSLSSTSRSQEKAYAFCDTSYESTTTTTNHYITTSMETRHNHNNNDKKELSLFLTKKEEKEITTTTTTRSDESLILRRVGADAITRTLGTISNYVINHLVDLNLTRNNLTELPDILSNVCPHLKFLNVSFNLFTMIPPVLFQMHQLISLNLADNQITEISPEFPSALPYLKHLILFGNLLTYLPETIQNWTQLTCLQLGSEFSGNQLTELPNHWPPSIQVLNISHNRLCHLHSLTGLKKLITLDASYNQLHSLGEKLIEWQQIKTIHVSNNRLTWLPSDIVELDTLKLLDVSYNLINVFPEGLLENSSLDVVITGNPLSYPGQQSVGPLLPEGVEQQQQQQQQRQRRRRRSTHSSISSSSLSSDSENNSSDSDRSNDEHVEQVEESYEDNIRNEYNNYSYNNSQSNILLNHLSSSSSTEQYQQEQAVNKNNNNSNNHDPGVNSLYEIAFRQILQSSSSSPDSKRRMVIPTHYLPTHLSHIHQQGENFTCVVCKGPFLREWISSTYLRNYRGYPSVARNIRFCSRQCLKRHSERAKEIAERRPATMMNRPPLPTPIDFGSFEWIVAAADAAKEQQAIEEDWF